MKDGSEIQCLASYSSVFKPEFLSGKIAFVSGGGTGICFRIVEALMHHGCSVAIASRRLNVLESAKAKLEKAMSLSSSPAKCFCSQMDVRKPESVEAAVEATMKHYGRIDILVNGAAGNFLCPAESISSNAFKTVMDIDTNGTFLLSQAVFRQCMKKNGGCIVNITATLHYNGEMLQTHAGAAKAAIEAMSRHLANEWGRHNVRINNIAPGPIEDTVGFEKLGGFLPASIKTRMRDRIALRRLGHTSDVSQSVLYLCSDAASYVTGTTLVVDGGSWFFGGGLVAEALQSAQGHSISKL